MMRVIICGGRTYHLTADDLARLDALLAVHPITEVVHGGATGVDIEAAAWATARGIATRPFRVYPSDWAEHGKAAGPLRNAAMLQYLQHHPPAQASMVIAFPGGRGTLDMKKQAQRAGIPVHVVADEYDAG